MANNTSKNLKPNVKPDNAFNISNLNLWYNYGSKHALKNINLAIKHREIVAFIGPSGCGKSTLLRCLNRMNDLIEGVEIKGSILFDEAAELVTNKSSSMRRLLTKKTATTHQQMSPLELRTRVGMVFQKPNPFPMSIYENVVFGPRSFGVRNKKELDQIAQKALTNAALWEEVKDSLSEPALNLSGGQQQRLCIARALALEPEVILMDEPTASLDPIATARIEELLTTLREKYTIIIVTHSMQQAARLADQTAFFYLGELIEYDTTKKIFTHPTQKLTSDYISGKMG